MPRCRPYRDEVPNHCPPLSCTPTQSRGRQLYWDLRHAACKCICLRFANPSLSSVSGFLISVRASVGPLLIPVKLAFAVMASPRLPLELVDHIINDFVAVDAEDPNEIRLSGTYSASELEAKEFFLACSMVCHAWHCLARAKVFRFVSLNCAETSTMKIRRHGRWKICFTGRKILQIQFLSSIPSGSSCNSPLLKWRITIEL